MAGEATTDLAVAREVPGASRLQVVGIGASAGGLEALQRFFEKMPSDSGLAFVVVQHLSPDHKSLMVELLSKYTQMNVRRVEDEMAVEPNVVYLLPPKKHVVIGGDRLKLADRTTGHGMPLPIDIFFGSLAEARGEAAVGIILSGTGSDGVRGVREIKSVGGTVLVQDEESAKFDGMPRAAISTGVVDAVLQPEEMPRYLGLLARHFRENQVPLDPASGEIADHYARIMALLRRQTGADFTHYKSTTVLRRIERRMGVNSLTRLSDYAQLLADDPREIATLYKELLIGVTRFFRDGEAFELLRTKIIPQIIESTRWDQQIRVWVPACSTGEEAYSIAMMFLEQMEAIGKRLSLKIFATDIDRSAIETAAAGIYPESIAADVSAERLSRFFTPRGETYQVSRDLRSLVLFAVHSLIRDPPFTRMDLVSCRNLLIYLEPDLQHRVLSLLHFGLSPGRFLMLGPSETIGEAGAHYQLVDAKWKVFQAVGAPRMSLSESLVSGQAERRRGFGESRRLEDARRDSADDAYRWLTAEFAPPTMQVTETGELVHVFGDAADYLSVPVGKASLHLLDMLARPLSAAVSTALHQASQQGKEIRYADVRTGVGEDDRVNVRVVPLPGHHGERNTLLVVLERPSVAPLVPFDGRSLDGVIEERISDLQEELQYTKENLQATIEELETSNEELQATNEELLSSNEELQSTNEELQSVNEELHTVNTEYQAKIQELSDLNADLDNLLRGTNIGTLFLDENLSIRRFTQAVAGLVNVIPRDVGRPLEHFSLNFEAPTFLEDVRHTLVTGNVLEREVAAHDGRRYLVRIVPYQGASLPQRGVVVTFVDVTILRAEQARLQSIIDALAQQIVVLGADGRVAMVNRAWALPAPEGELVDGVPAGPPPLGTLKEFLLAVVPEAAERARAGLSEILAGTRAVLRLVTPEAEGWTVLEAAALPPALGGAVVSVVHVEASEGVPGATASERPPRGP